MNKVFAVGFLVLLSGFSKAQDNEDKRYAQPELPGDLMVDIGMTFLYNDPAELDIQNFNSRSVGVYYSQRFKLSDRFTFNPALGITAEKLRLDNNLNFQLADDNTIVFDSLLNRGDLRTNKIAINYIELPFELRFYPTRTVDGEGLFVSVGGIIGARLESHTKIKYDFNNIRRAEKLRDRFGLQDFRFGFQGRVGLRGIHVFYKYYFTEVFRPGRSPGENAAPGLWTFGINISGF